MRRNDCAAPTRFLPPHKIPRKKMGGKTKWKRRNGREMGCCVVLATSSHDFWILLFSPCRFNSRFFRVKARWEGDKAKIDAHAWRKEKTANRQAWLFFKKNLPLFQAWQGFPFFLTTFFLFFLSFFGEVKRGVGFYLSPLPSSWSSPVFWQDFVLGIRGSRYTKSHFSPVSLYEFRKKTPLPLSFCESPRRFAKKVRSTKEQ